MAPKSKPEARLTQSAYDDLKKLPGNTRHEMVSAVNNLQRNPRPPQSKQLLLEGEKREIRRLRLGNWRIIYAIINDIPAIIGIKHRPPYDYSDIETILREMEK